ncbi:MAG: hypothetical protein N3A58_08160 [Spirochaetes bacterium]|nr:hypothetical protein [Spirochaetota bacterium]
MNLFFALNTFIKKMKIKKISIIFFLSLSIFLVNINDIYGGEKIEIVLNIYSDIGCPLENTQIYDDKNSLIGVTSQDGVFKTIFYNNFPMYLLINKDGFERVIIQLKRKKLINLSINLSPIKNTQKEVPFNGIFYKDKVPLSKSIIYIKSAGLLKEVWTDNDGRFSTTITRDQKVIIFYIESFFDKDSYVENIYIEEIQPEEIKNDLNYIYTSSFIKKNYTIKNLFKNPSYYFLRLVNDTVYFTDIGNEFSKKNYFNNLKLNIYSKNDRVFKNYQIFLDLRFEISKIKEISLVRLLEEEYLIEFKEDTNNYIFSSLDYEVGINFKRLSNNFSFGFYNIEVFEEELKKFIFYDKNGNQNLSVYFFDENFKINENIFKNLYYYSFSIVINKSFSYDQFLDDFYFKSSKETIFLNFFGNL